MNSTGCRVSVGVEGGRLVEVRPAPADVASGLCDRVDGILEWEYSDERLTKPMKKTESGWKEITWDEALSFIAEKLEKIKAEYGARAVVVNTGQALVRNVNRRAAKRFAKAFGTPNFTSGDSFCFWSRCVGHTIALGIGDSAANLDLEASNCIMVIGHNPSESARASEKKNPHRQSAWCQAHCRRPPGYPPGQRGRYLHADPAGHRLRACSFYVECDYR